MYFIFIMIVSFSLGTLLRTVGIVTPETNPALTVLACIAISIFVVKLANAIFLKD